MINTFLNRIEGRKTDRAVDMAQQMSTILPKDENLTNWIGSALSTAKASGLSRSQLRSAMRTARKGARSAARRGSTYAMANPRNVGLGVGAAAVAAVGLYAFARMKETRDTRPADLSDPVNTDE